MRSRGEALGQREETLGQRVEALDQRVEALVKKLNTGRFAGRYKRIIYGTYSKKRFGHTFSSVWLIGY